MDLKPQIINVEFDTKSQLISLMTNYTQQIVNNSNQAAKQEAKLEFIDEIEDDEDYIDPQKFQQTSNGLKIVSVMSLKNYCHVCSLDFASQAYLKRHNNTKKHQYALSLAQRGRKLNRKRGYLRLSDFGKGKSTLLQNDLDMHQVTDDEMKQIQQSRVNIDHQGQFVPPMINRQIISYSTPQIDFFYEKESMTVPQNEPENFCHSCKKSFNHQAHYTQHMNSAHLGERKFRCPTCGKRFESNDLLKNHMMKHIEDKPFKCSKCTKSFIYKTDMRRHEKMHDAVKEHVCEICGHGFVRRDHLQKHYNYHQRRINMGLPINKMKHIEDNPFKCSKCTKSFVYKSDMRRHEKMHDAVKEHVCEICGQEFVRRDHLQKHYNYH